MYFFGFESFFSSAPGVFSKYSEIYVVEITT
jgi:hypothetical protein